MKKLILAISVFLLFGSSFANAQDVHMDFTALTYFGKNEIDSVHLVEFSCGKGNCRIEMWLIKPVITYIHTAEKNSWGKKEEIKILYDNMKDSIGFEFEIFGGLRKHKCSLEYEDATGGHEDSKYVTFFKCIAKNDFFRTRIKKGDVSLILYKELVSLTHTIGEEVRSSRYINGNIDYIVPKK